MSETKTRQTKAECDYVLASGSSAYTEFCERLDELPKDQRIDAIDDAIHRLQFERRWQSLAPNQVKHMCDESLSDAESEALASCKTEAEREERISMYARARYFRRCHWRMYLNGESSEPPVERAVAKLDAQKAKFESFVDLVRSMREKQTEYFKTRDRGLISESKKLEREVDQMIKGFENTQGDLF